MEQYFYIDKSGQQQGPVSANELPKYGVTRNTQVWKQGMANWQTAGSIPELSSILPPTTTYLPPNNVSKKSTSDSAGDATVIILKIIATIIILGIAIWLNVASKGVSHYGISLAAVGLIGAIWGWKK